MNFIRTFFHTHTDYQNHDAPKRGGSGRTFFCSSRVRYPARFVSLHSLSSASISNLPSAFFSVAGGLGGNGGIYILGGGPSNNREGGAQSFLGTEHKTADRHDRWHDRRVKRSTLSFSMLAYPSVKVGDQCAFLSFGGC